MFDWRRPFYFLLWCFHAFLFHFESWLATRTTIWFVQGIPALVVAVSTTVVVINSRLPPSAQLMLRYDFAISEAMQRSDWATAELFLHKLLHINEHQTDLRYRLALIAEKRGEMARAGELMAELAPNQSPGYPAAHFWRARQMLANPGQLSAADTDLLIHHLQSSLANQATSISARSILGQVYFLKQDYAKAVPHLAAVADSHPRWRLLLAKAYVVQGSRQLATQALTLVIDEYDSRLEANADDLEARVGLAEAEALDGKFDRAIKVLEAGITGKHAAQCRQSLANIYVLRYDAETKEGPADHADRLAYLEKSLQLTPNHVPSLVRLIRYLNRGGPAGALARSAIQDALAKGKSPALLHLMLGTQAAQGGNMSEAQMHLEQAQRLDPRAPVVLNNLAWVLAQSDPPQLAEALRLANAAVQQAPRHAQIRETRGQILARMKNWKEALVDLELALPDMPNHRALHATLADVYQQLGNDEMAARHRRFLAEADAAAVDGTVDGAMPDSEPPR